MAAVAPDVPVFRRLLLRASTAVLAAALLLLGPPPARAAIRRALTVTDATGTAGTITVETSTWKLVFDQLYNGGVHQWFDLAADPSETDSLAGALAGTFPYSQGALFGYQAYLFEAPSMEFMTTLGMNADPGSLSLTVIENTPARVRIRQIGQPRLNNGFGPTSDVFPEIGIITATTLWTIYPTGKIHIDFSTEVESAGITIDSGPGGMGKGVDASGTTLLVASAGNDFRENGVLPGDTIESATGGWGPLRIVDRPMPTQLRVAAAVPAATGLDYVVRRREIVGETISIHGDGDPGFGFCGTHPWQAGSVDKPLWDDSPIPQVVPNLANQYLLAQWATEGRQAGSLLTFFEQPWPDPTLAAFDSCFYEDISYTQIGRFGLQIPQERHLHLLAHLGSAATCALPSIRSVADALPFGVDYRTPYAEALVGTLDTGPGFAAGGFDLGTGAYGVAASSVSPSTCGATSPPCYEAAVRFDTQGGGRGGAEYRTPAVMLSGLPVADGLLAVEMSTDGGSSFAPLSPALYNLTGETEEAALGAGRRLFQYLADIASSATGASSVVFRVVGPLTPAPPPPPTEPCASAPRTGCGAPGKASFQLHYDGGAKNKLVWRWGKGSAPVSTFGDPARRCGTGFAMCVYDSVASAPTLAIVARVDGGGTCGAKPCWKAVGSNPVKGFSYKDATSGADGFKTIKLRGGKPGADKIAVAGAGSALPLPVPSSGSQYFRHEGSVVVQLVGDTDACWEATFAPTDVRQNVADAYKATAVP